MAKYGAFNYGGGRPFPNPQKYGLGLTYPIFRPDHTLGKYLTLEESHLEGVIYTYGGLQSEEIIGFARIITPRGGGLRLDENKTNISMNTSFEVWHLLPSQEISMMGGETKTGNNLQATDRVIKNIGKVETIPQAGNRFMR